MKITVLRLSLIVAECCDGPAGSFLRYVAVASAAYRKKITRLTGLVQKPMHTSKTIQSEMKWLPSNLSRKTTAWTETICFCHKLVLICTRCWKTKTKKVHHQQNQWWQRNRLRLRKGNNNPVVKLSLLGRKKQDLKTAVLSAQ